MSKFFFFVHRSYRFLKVALIEYNAIRLFWLFGNGGQLCSYLHLWKNWVQCEVAEVIDQIRKLVEQVGKLRADYEQQQKDR